MDESYQALIESDRVGAATRDALNRRSVGQEDEKPRRLADAQYATLNAVAHRLVPQSASGELVDIAAGVDAALHDDETDGWRYADVPPDADAFAAGLNWIDSLANEHHRRSFVELDHATQDRLLERLLDGEMPCAGMNGKHWCEDLLAMAVKIYVSHPTTLARINFGGIAFRPEWPAVGLGTTQPWEPSAL